MTPQTFWTKVIRGEGCWLWTGATAGRPGEEYGRCRWTGGVARPAHRIAYELAGGTIPEGLALDHLCRNRLCVRPDHLEPVSYRENMLRGESPAAIAHRAGRCRRGHPAEDIYYGSAKGTRYCRGCERLHYERRVAAGRSGSWRR